MSSLRFNWGTDEQGNEGWISATHPNFWAADPRNIAHDVLEHFPRAEKHGAAADELLALGARFYLRVASGWWWSQGYMVMPPETWAGELRTVWDDLYTDLPARAAAPLDDEDMEAELQACLVKAVDVINEQIACSDDPELITLESYFIVNAGAWLRTGYRAAQKRFKGTDPLYIMGMAEQIEAEMKDYEHGEEGEVLTVRVNEKFQTFNIDVRGLYE